MSNARRNRRVGHRSGEVSVTERGFEMPGAVKLTGVEQAEQMFGRREPFVLAFVSRGCGYCALLAPEYSAAGEAVRDAGYPVPFYYVDVSAGPRESPDPAWYPYMSRLVFTDMNLRGFPVILRFARDRGIENFDAIGAPRTAQNLFGFALRGGDVGSWPSPPSFLPV